MVRIVKVMLLQNKLRMNYYTVTQVCWIAGTLQPSKIKISVHYYQNQIVLNKGLCFIMGLLFLPMLPTT